MGLPPDKLFYLYIPIGCLDSSLLLQTERDSGHRRSFAACVKWSPGQVNDVEAAGYLLCGNPLSWGFTWWLEFELFVCLAPNEASFCIYINALQHFNIIYRTKGNRRISRMRQSMHFFSHQKYSQAFCEGTYPLVSFMYRHSSSACSHFLSHNFKYLCTILTLWRT